MNSGPDLNGLQTFVREGDRTEPLYFAGREAELREMEALLGSVKKGKAGLTRVITAAPGAGKTALLRKLEARWKRSKAARPVVLEASAFGDPAQVIKRMFLALEDPAAGRFASVETKTEAEHAEGGVNVVGLAAKAGGRSSHSLQRTNLQETFFDAFRELEDRETPVVLLVDEAQNWGADQEAGNGGRISSLLSEAHQNSDKLPLLIIATGLGDTCDALRRCGISRLTANAKIPLEPLSGDEQREVCKAFFDRFRIVGDTPLREKWIEALIQRTGGYPKHLTNALFGAAETLIAGEGDLTKSSLEAARDSANGFRRKFYYDQTEPFQGMQELLTAVFAEMDTESGARSGASPSRSVIRKAITRAYKDTPDLADEMPKRDVFRKLLHQGLIQDFGYDRYDCPIPGMRKHVLAFSARAGSPTVKISAEAVPEPGM